MTDVFPKEKRSEIMSRVRGKNTGPELLIRSALHRLGYRFRLHDSRLPGTPDIILKKHKTVIFINGCFWHGHKNCRYSALPATNREFWEKKIAGNVARDEKNRGLLRKEGWKVITVWTCRMRNPGKAARSIDAAIRRRG